MDSHEQLTIRVRNESIDIVLADGDMWFSQSCLSVIFETTTQNINLHLAKLNEIRLSKFFPILQKEGSRTVQRKIRHFNFESAHAIAIRAQRFSELNELVDNAARRGALKQSYRIIPIQERHFAEILTVTLRGITSVECQFQVMGYRIDFFLPEFRLAIEYDESHHAKPLQIRRDNERQKLITSKFGWKFIRVRQGKEFQGINRILKFILSRPSKPSRIVTKS